MLFGCADSAGGPVAVIRIAVVHGVIHDAGDIHAAAEERGLIGHGDESEESAVAEAPNADAIFVHVGKSFEIVGAHPGIFCVFSADIHIHASAPIAAVADAAAIVGSKHDVTLLE